MIVKTCKEDHWNLIEKKETVRDPTNDNGKSMGNLVMKIPI